MRRNDDKKKKDQKGSSAKNHNVIKAKYPSSGQTPFGGKGGAGTFAPSKSPYTPAAQKRMAATASGSQSPIYSKTRVLPEMSGKLSVKTPATKLKMEKPKVAATKSKSGKKR